MPAGTFFGKMTSTVSFFHVLALFSVTFTSHSEHLVALIFINSGGFAFKCVRLTSIFRALRASSDRRRHDRAAKLALRSRTCDANGTRYGLPSEMMGIG